MKSSYNYAVIVVSCELVHYWMLQRNDYALIPGAWLKWFWLSIFVVFCGSVWPGTTSQIRYGRAQDGIVLWQAEQHGEGKGPESDARGKGRPYHKFHSLGAPKWIQVNPSAPNLGEWLSDSFTASFKLKPPSERITWLATHQVTLLRWGLGKDTKELLLSPVDAAMAHDLRSKSVAELGSMIIPKAIMGHALVKLTKTIDLNSWRIWENTMRKLVKGLCSIVSSCKNAGDCLLFQLSLF